MPVNIYPPILASSQPAFLYTQPNGYKIYFNLQKITSKEQIKHIQIRIVTKTNNRSIADFNQYPDGIIYKTTMEPAETANQYYVTILDSDLSDKWTSGVSYKVQIRFGKNELYTNIQGFADWKQAQIQETYAFSEWSTVMIIKAIEAPTIKIENADALNSSDIFSSQYVEATLTPQFIGSCLFNESSKETVDKYKFDLYLGTISLEEFQKRPVNARVESSNWLQHNESISSIDTYRFKNILINKMQYSVFYSIKSKNGYETVAAPYYFTASQTYYMDLENVLFEAKDDEIYCKENGCINLYLTSNERLSGSFVITRSSETTNYQVWETLKHISCFAKKFNEDLIFSDFTVESGIRYKYAIQQENKYKLRSSPIIDNVPKVVNFEYSYVYHNNVQLRLMFNQQLSSFKHTVLTSKQDTLGDKYPHLTKNGYAYYAEFPISGTISFQMDLDHTFLHLENYGYYYEDSPAISRDKFLSFVLSRDSNITNYNDLTIDHNLTDDNIFVERKFREQVESFLNNFDYKLYKSPTEGNIVIVLQNVSMTPNSTLGRMIYDFSATAYEVLENNLSNLDKYSIIDIGEYESLTSDEITLSFGQIKGLYKEQVAPVTRNTSICNIFDKIKEVEEIKIEGGYKFHLKDLRSIWIERYPNRSFKFDLMNLYAEQAKLKNNNQSTTEIDQQIAEMELLEQQIKNNPEQSVIKLLVNNTEILVPANTQYILEEPIESLELVASRYPIIVNYVAELTRVEDSEIKVVTAVQSSNIWGQFSGIFTDNENLIKYNYTNYLGDWLRVFDDYAIGDKYDKNGNILVDTTNFNIYQTRNLYEIIKEEVKKQVEYIYGVTEGFVVDEDGNWDSKQVQSKFVTLSSFDIETDPNTNILIGKAADGSDAVKVKIGPSGKYLLSPVDNLVRYIVLEKPAFAIINYKCFTQQSKLKEQVGE